MDDISSHLFFFSETLLRRFFVTSRRILFYLSYSIHLEVVGSDGEKVLHPSGAYQITYQNEVVSSFLIVYAKYQIELMASSSPLNKFVNVS